MIKEKITLEFDMKSTPISMLWAYISTANGLKEWFADDAQINGKDVVLIWNGVSQESTIISMRFEKYIRFRSKEDNDKSFIEMRISSSEMTNNAILTITDFAEPDDVEEIRDLWNYQVETLQRQLGC